MEFSAPMRCRQVAVSPDGAYMATTLGVRLSVFSVTTQEEVVHFACLDDPQIVQWSPDSLYLLSAVPSRRAVQLWSVEDPDWRCRIDESDAGLQAVRWAPSSRHVLTTSEVSLRLTVWSLVDKAVCYIKYLKDVPSGLEFSPDGDFLAVIERRALKDHVSVFNTRAWDLVKHIEEVSENAAGLVWSPDSEMFCVWDDWQRFRLVVYDLAGRQLGELKLPDDTLGVSSVSWCPSGQLLAVAGHDDKVRLVSHVTWRVLTTLQHGALVRGGRWLHVYREQESRLAGFRLDLAMAAGTDYVTDVTYELSEERPVTLRPAKVAGELARLRQGVGLILFSPDNKYMATRYDVMPECVWVWSLAYLSLHTLLVHRSAVRHLVWEPQGSRLAICTGSRYLYMWSPDQASTCRSPADVSVTQLLWPDDSTLLLQAKDSLLFCRLEEQQVHEQRSVSPIVD